MGIAILSGLLSSLEETRKAATATSQPSPDLPTQLPTSFIACVTRSKARLEADPELSKHSSTLTVVENANLASIQQADIILLACKPFYAAKILSEPGIRAALANKLLVSICAGVTVPQFESIFYPDGPVDPAWNCRIVRVLPNTNSIIRESMTVIETSTPPLSAAHDTLVRFIFRQIGQVAYLPATNMDAATALCGSGPAFVHFFIESLMHGGLSAGIPRDQLQFLVAQTVLGTTKRAFEGKHPALLKDEVCTPGGCTIYGLNVMERGGFKSVVADTVMEATIRAGELGRLGSGPRRT